MKNDISFIVESNKGKNYFEFNNNQKKWLINTASVKKGFDMYQPSSFKGKIAKSFIIKFPKLAKKIGIVEEKKILIDEDLNNKIKSIFGVDNYTLSFYKGDDSSWQNNKVMVQVCTNNSIIGYVKITSNPNVIMLMKNEVSALNKLKENNFPFISNVLYSGKVKDYYLLAQDTNKTKAKTLKLKFNREILDLVKQMTDSTIIDTDYEKSDIYSYIEYLKEIDSTIYRYDVIKQAIEYVEERIAEEKIEYAFSHGDFTPWNIYESYHMKYLIDFEYSLKAMPRYIDVFHYMTQYAFLAKQGDVGTAVGLFRNKRKMLCDYIGKPELICAMYLLYIISFYMQRVDEFKEDETYKNRVDFLEYIINRNFKK